LYKVLSNPNPYHQRRRLPITRTGGRRRVDSKKIKKT
jgi:hypothetical protein